MTQANGEAGGNQRYKRSAKNYLIDPAFQLKYTGFLVAITLAMSVGLGIMLYRSGGQVIDQSRQTVAEGTETVAQGQRTIERGQEVVRQSKKVSQVVTMYIEKEYGENQDLLKTFREEAAKDEEKLNQEQVQLEKDAETLRARAARLEQQSADMVERQITIFLGLVGGLAILVLGIGVAGIIFTHKISGPIFKMKRLLREVGKGRLVVREKLRKGDELMHFFEAFEHMVEDLRDKQKVEIAEVDAILARLEANSDDPAEAVALLKKLRAEMQAEIEP